MKIAKVNHVITAVKGMLDDLVTEGVIGNAQKDDLLTPLVLHAIKNDSIDIGE